MKFQIFLSFSAIFLLQGVLSTLEKAGKYRTDKLANFRIYVWYLFTVLILLLGSFKCFAPPPRKRHPQGMGHRGIAEEGGQIF